MRFYENESVSLYLNNLTTISSYQSLKQDVKLFSHPWKFEISLF